MTTVSVMLSLIGLVCLLLTRTVHALSLCDAGDYLEAKEGLNSTFVCTGLTPQQSVYWLWESVLLSTCTTTGCSNDIYPDIFKIGMTQTTSSDLTVYTPLIHELDYLATTQLSCRQGSGQNIVKCQLDVVYPKCQIEFSGDTWEVTGWCTVSKARSRRNRYGCLVSQISQPSSSTFVGNFTMSTTPIIGTTYFSGYCQIRIGLPREGKYNYSVTIIPGEVQVFPSFNGSNEIRRPTVSPRHNCPQYVTEGEDVDCLCYSDNLGLPSGSLIWIRSSSSRLMINKVNRTITGLNFFCVLMWNNTEVQNITYGLTVNYASRVLNFKIDNKADEVVTVKENTNVSVVCQAEGRPLPTIRLFNRNSDNQDVELTAVNNALELHYTMSVKCETSASYSCKSENGVSVDEKHISLIVFCAPRQTTQDSYSAKFNGGEARLKFKITAYPTPNALYIFHTESSLNATLRKVESKNTVNFECTSDTLYRYMVTCTVTLLNEAIYSTGVYHAVFSNGLGNISLTFEIKEHVDTTGQSKSEVAGPVAGGVTGAVVVIVLAVSAAIVIIRKKRRRHERGSRTNPVMTSETDPQRSLETLYDQLQRGDINNPSVYQTLGAQQASKDFKDHKDSHDAVRTSDNNCSVSDTSSHKTSGKSSKVYDALCLQEVGVSSHYASLK